MSGDNVFYTVMKVKGCYYLYNGVYVNGRKKLIYIGPYDKIGGGGPAGIRTQDLRLVRAAS